MNIENDVVNRVSLTKADFLEAIRDYLFKGSVKGDTSEMTEVQINAITDFNATSDDFELITLVLKLED